MPQIKIPSQIVQIANTGLVVFFVDIAEAALKS